MKLNSELNIGRGEKLPRALDSGLRTAKRVAVSGTVGSLIPAALVFIGTHACLGEVTNEAAEGVQVHQQMVGEKELLHNEDKSIDESIEKGVQTFRKDLVALAKEKNIELDENTTELVDILLTRVKNTQQLNQLNQELARRKANFGKMENIETITPIIFALVALVGGFFTATDTLEGKMIKRDEEKISDVKERFFKALSNLGNQSSDAEFALVLKAFAQSIGRLAKYSQDEKNEVVKQCQRIFKETLEEDAPPKRSSLFIRTVEDALEPLGIDQSFRKELSEISDDYYGKLSDLDLLLDLT